MAAEVQLPPIKRARVSSSSWWNQYPMSKEGKLFGLRGMSQNSLQLMSILPHKYMYCTIN